MTLAEALRHGADRVGQRDAILLLAHVTGYSKSRIRIYGNEALSEPSRVQYMKCLERRQRHEPVQYIIGKWDFMGLELNVDKRALIPRPETELLVEEALKFIKEITEKRGGSQVKVLDVCTGSGCIALAIAHLTDASEVSITATDISRDALSLASENATKNRFWQKRQNFIESDLLDKVTGTFDVIISNPPYILSGDMAGLSETVRGFEPHLALDGGADGMDIYRRLIPQCVKALNPGGVLLLEIGVAEVADLMTDAGFKDVKILRDYAGLERIIIGVR